MVPNPSARSIGLAIFVIVACVDEVKSQAPKGLEEALSQFDKAMGKGLYQVGEEVDFSWHNKTYVALITKIDNRSGLIELKFNVDGKEQTTRAFPLDPRLKKRTGGAPKAAATGASRQPEKEYPARTWTDSTGKFKIDASYAGQDAAGVKLKKTDGKTIQLALDKLSPQDQQYIAGVLSPAADANPFESAKELTVVPNADRQARWSTARHIDVQLKENWSLTLDPGPSLSAPADGRVVTLWTKTQQNFFESPAKVLLDTAHSKAIVVSINSPPNAEKRLRLSIVDTKSVAHEADIHYAGQGTPVDVSPSGKRLVAISTEVASHSQNVEIVQFDDKVANVVRRWDLGEWANGPAAYLDARFISDDKVLTSNAWGNKLALWDADKAEAIWTLEESLINPAISPGRKQIAVATRRGIAILDSTTGQTLAAIAGPGLDHGSLAFSPDGSRLGHLTSQELRAWDLSTGKVRQEMWFPKQMGSSSLEFVGGPYVLVNHQFLVNLDKRIVLWQYESAQSHGRAVGQFGGGKNWLVTSSGLGVRSSYGLRCVSIPDAAAKSKDDSIGGNLFVLKPGARVALNINLPDANDVPKATKHLTTQLQAAGMVVDPAAPLVLEASINDAGSETKKYSRFAFSRDGEEATVSKQMSVLSLKENGREVWVATGRYGSAPSMVLIKSGQSIQEAVNEKQINPAQFFFNVKLPPYLARHPEGGVFGSSKLD